MERIQKIPLAERIQTAAVTEPNRLSVFRLFTEDYFAGLAEISGDSRIAGYINEGAIAPYLAEFERMPPTVDFIARLTELPKEEAAQPLYEALIAPFAALQQEEERIEQECTSLPF